MYSRFMETGALVPETELIELKRKVEEYEQLLKDAVAGPTYMDTQQLQRRTAYFDALSIASTSTSSVGGFDSCDSFGHLSVGIHDMATKRRDADFILPRTHELQAPVDVNSCDENRVSTRLLQHNTAHLQTQCNQLSNLNEISVRPDAGSFVLYDMPYLDSHDGNVPGLPSDYQFGSFIDDLSLPSYMHFSW